MSDYVFISHTSKDDEFVKALREKLEAHGIVTWVDSRELVAGNKLDPEIETAIDESSSLIAVLSPNAVNSKWVSKEIQKALKIEEERKDEGYRVIPVMLPGIKVGALHLWFGDVEPVGLPIQTDVGGLDKAIIPLLEALGKRLPDDRPSIRDIPAPPVDELILRLQDPKIEEFDGKHRAAAIATLIHDSLEESERAVESQRFKFTAPIGAIEHEEIRWYLEEYLRWPVGVFKQRAEQTESQLPIWGQALYQAALGEPVVQEALRAWVAAAGKAARRFSIWVDAEPVAGTSTDDAEEIQEAASALLALPWELIHDGRGYIFTGRNPVRVRRRLPNRFTMDAAIAELPIRILLLTPRAEDQYSPYIDHRVSARPLVAAVENLGELAELTVLEPPTFTALRSALESAAVAGKPFDVIHFNGHGIYDRFKGLGALVFEDQNEIEKLFERASDLIDAQKFADLVKDHRIPLVFLEACQGAQFDKDPTASVAAKLLDAGVTSVIAMTHSVLVESARRFTESFYGALARGERVGQAMLAGQTALADDPYRGEMMGVGKLQLCDWFVPVLYQEEQDPQLFTQTPDAQIQHLQAQAHKIRLGALPEPPPHTFIGRSRSLLALERLLQRESEAALQYAVILGTGGAGKTTIAVELARWLARTNRFDRVAFASLEFTHDARSLLDTLGRQLLPAGDKYTVAQYGDDMKAARLPVERALRDQRVLLVVDNVESVLPSPSPEHPEPVEGTGEGRGEAAQAAEGWGEVATLLQTLLAAATQTRLLLTTRETLPPPFDVGKQYIRLGALSQRDAVDLVSQVLTAAGAAPPAADPGQTDEEIEKLVESVGRHARALVLIAREVADRGVVATTASLSEIMAALEAKHPGERENSLFASLELSLQRLTEDGRQALLPLGAFHGGYTRGVLDMMIGDEAESLVTQSLVTVGLAQPDEYGYLKLDPALPPYLWMQMTAEEQTNARERWGQAMGALIGFLYQQRSQDWQMGARLTQLELPNLLAALDWAEAILTPEEVVDLAGSVEQLLVPLNRPRALALAVAVRERNKEHLGEWGHARFETERLNVIRLVNKGALPAAHEAVQNLITNATTAGENAYPGADYDLALAYFNLGWVLKTGGAATTALEPLAEAQHRFEALGEHGENMAAKTFTEMGDCYRAIGKLEDAADAYLEAIRRGEKQDDRRGVAVRKGQLGTVRMYQQHYEEALEIFAEARAIFEGLGEPESVAAMWHQTGRVHQEAGNYAEAERAYRQSLAIAVKRGDRRGQASTLSQLGILHDHYLHRLEDAVALFQQAADIYTKLKDMNSEGRLRYNIAVALIKLQRYDEARQELLRAIECKKPYGHAATPWNGWNLLYKLENAVGDEAAAAQARAQAKAAYLAYRRQGGYAQPGWDENFGITEADL